MIAIEPVPENLECLRRNLPNDIEAGRVTIYPKGIWDHEDVMPMQISEENGAEDCGYRKLCPGVGTLASADGTTAHS